MEIDKSQFFQVFYEETGEHLAAMEGLLINLNIESPDAEDLNAIFRAVHSIKGGAGTFGFKELTRVAHVFETVLDKVRKGEIQPTSEMIDIFLESGDFLSTLLAGYRDNTGVNPEASDPVIERLKVLLDKPKADAVSVEAGKKEAQAPPQVKEKPETVSKSETDEATSETESETDEDPGYGFFDDAYEEKPEAETEEDADKSRVSANEDRPAAQAEKCEKQAIKSEDGNKPENSKKIAKGTPAGRPARKSQKHAENATIRIDVEKVDQLFNQVGEIVITQAMLAQTASHIDPEIFEKLESGLAQLERNTRDLQESVMGIRMVPIRMVFNRFPRLVRDMKRKFNKEIELVMIGEETEIDKGFIEKLSDPLTHLIRNSFDHGLESPEIRKAAGKNPQGTIILSASHQGGNVVIEVSDDGAGLNREKILAKARDQGIPVPEIISDTEVWNLIFAAGFSTAKTISDISGRGVGMDVVRKNVQAMDGVVEIESVEGCGSRFIIRLPLTLAIIEGMVVRVGSECYILPIASVVESIQPGEADIKRVFGECDLVNMRGEFIPVVRLHEIFGIESEVIDPTKAVLSIVESGGGLVALMVDELVGQQQVVIKSLEENFRKVDGIAGATILGDGHVAFIVDVRSLRSFSKQSEKMLVS